ncbi:MAG: uroporphyrinogen decarboxylase family protein [Clostridiaceae bacterium]|nr:uroporphyrinogen decarboxylase family protein [Clostridiaceae bacterium]
MNRMTKKERVMAAINKQEVDRIPFSIWYHVPHVDQDPVQLAEVQIEQAHSYDLDFIKMMPFGNYGAHDYGLSCTFYCTETQPVLERKFAIDDVKEWTEIEPLPGNFGNHGKQLMIARQLKKQLKGEEIPYVQTIFSPLTTAKKLAGPRIFADMRSNPEYLHQALAAITETTINFVKLNIEEGVAGFFFATQCANKEWVSEAEYDEFGVKYDLQVINAYKDITYFNIAHIHGDNTMFEKVANYPCNCINWHDRWTSPNMAEARKLTDKCLLGCINEKWLSTAKAEEVRGHVREGVLAAGRTGLMVTPGCVAQLDTPAINFYAARLAVEGL